MLHVLVGVMRGNLDNTKQSSSSSGNEFGRSDPPLAAAIIKLLFYLHLSSSHTYSVIKGSRLLRMKSNGSNSCSFICNWDKPLVTITHLEMRWLTQIILLSLTQTPALGKTRQLKPLFSEERAECGNKTRILRAQSNNPPDLCRGACAAQLLTSRQRRLLWPWQDCRGGMFL